MASKGYDFKALENDILKFWEDNNIYQSIKKKNHGKQKFYWLQGPPYTSGRIHLGTAWNHCLKDLLLRYKRMKGFDVWDRGGWDMHGLPTESKVQKKFDLATKKDIVEFGMEKFVKECLKFSEENAELMSQDFWRMGVWMNNNNAYMPIHNSFIEGVWYLIKKAHEKNRLYEGKKVMTWCKSCETALAKHELEYKTVKDLSIFVKFRIQGKSDEYLIIWTTTPWTIPFNLAVMVNPELDYIRAKVLVDEKQKKYETWIVSTVLSGVFINGVANKQYEMIEQFKGDKLLGLKYQHPFHDEMPIYVELQKKHKNVHTVILSEEFVDTSAGTGLVHCAPGCGPEDFEIGKRYEIPAFNDIDELGVFSGDTGRFVGMIAKDDDNIFIDVLREKGALIETSYVDHEYAHCGRCHNPVVFRATDQWFFKTEDLKDRMIEFNKSIYWYPETAKNAFDSWLGNLKDNSITKQRFWGTPVPIWICDDDNCRKFEVIGTIDELKQKSVDHKVPDNLHKPWIDAGSVSWNCLDYPKNTELFEKYFPADFIVEGKDQIRGWFNLLMVSSTLAFDRPSFKNVAMHGFITDIEGEKMSKSLGNIISPFEIIEKYGADTFRYYSIDITIGDDMNYSWDEVALKHKNLIILWNLHNFLIDFKNNNGISLVDVPKLDPEERYMLSRLHSTMKGLTNHLEQYHLDAAPGLIESLYMDLSRIYIQLVREKSVIGTDEEKEAILYTLYHTIINIIKMFSITCPFITEQIYMDIKQVEEFNLDKNSIHDFDWPEYSDKLIEPKLERCMSYAQEFIQAALSCRDRINLGVRWPLQECIVDTEDKEMIEAIQELKDILEKQVNVKNIKFEHLDAELKVKPNFKTLGKDFGNMTSKIIGLINENALSIAEHIKNNRSFKIEGFELTTNHVIIERVCPEGYEMASIKGGLVYLDKSVTKELELEGYSREIIRRVQQLRKDSALNRRDLIDLNILTGLDLKPFEKIIKDKVGARIINFGHSTKEYSATAKEIIKGREIVIMLNKLE